MLTKVSNGRPCRDNPRIKAEKYKQNLAFMLQLRKNDSGFAYSLDSESPKDSSSDIDSDKLIKSLIQTTN